ncbi:hypothetical protein [Bartonella sp. CL25QHWL]|uniref:hypothetical protein n=1 Tax=Bartonella sp. CL25QHWL TaxID=3243518 RepID=UPI0035CF6347
MLSIPRSMKQAVCTSSLDFLLALLTLVPSFFHALFHDLSPLFFLCALSGCSVGTSSCGVIGASSTST